MAMIRCPECGAEISEMAESCPKCGYPLAKMQKLESKWAVGKYVTFGEYPQDIYGEIELLEWRILARDAGRALLISRYGLDAKPYNEEFEDITWETCTLRSWLNGEFLDSAFTAEERNQIVMTDVPADENPYRDTDPGNVTQDKVFLLSIAEEEKYFKSENDCMCVPTAYAVENGCWTSDRDQKEGQATCLWWLRSPGNNQYNAACVNYDGDVDCIGYFVYFDSYAVRPALWVKIS